MGRHGGSRSETQRTAGPPPARHGASLWAVVTLTVVLLGALSATAAPEPKASAKVNKPNPNADVLQKVDAVVEAQRSVAVGLSELRDQLTEAQRTIGELRDQIKEEHEFAQGMLEQIKGMREEERGLYVESSGLKGDIAQVGKSVEGLDQSLGSFRLSAGIVVAAVIVLQFVLVGLTFRGRG